jgi:hypothetical protein
MMMNSRKRIARLAVLLAAVITVALSTGIATNFPASASTGCYATNCAGHDPTTHGCSASSTTTTNGTLATVWNRYSYACDANWARGQLTTVALNAGDKMQVMIFTVDRNHNSEGMCWPSPDNDQGFSDEFCDSYYAGSSIAYTDMVDGTNATQAWVQVYSSSGAYLTEYQADQ